MAKHMSETPNLRWFGEFPKCPRGKTANGILYGSQNESYGHWCRRYASRPLEDSERARAVLAKTRQEKE